MCVCVCVCVSVCMCVCMYHTMFNIHCLFTVPDVRVFTHEPLLAHKNCQYIILIKSTKVYIRIVELLFWSFSSLNPSVSTRRY